jgi:hypothetical protein
VNSHPVEIADGDEDLIRLMKLIFFVRFHIQYVCPREQYMKVWRGGAEIFELERSTNRTGYILYIIGVPKAQKLMEVKTMKKAERRR